MFSSIAIDCHRVGGHRSGEVRPERLVAAATELAQLPVDVIVTLGSEATHAAKQATTTIPIVMAAIGDPVRAGFVASLAHPAGNITGNTILGPELAPKRLQLLKLAVPIISRVAFLWNPDNPSHPNSPLTLLCQLPPAADMPSQTLIAG